jgi:hypothetical protein
MIVRPTPKVWSSKQVKLIVICGDCSTSKVAMVVHCANHTVTYSKSWTYLGIRVMWYRSVATVFADAPRHAFSKSERAFPPQQMDCWDPLFAAGQDAPSDVFLVVEEARCWKPGAISYQVFRLLLQSSRLLTQLVIDT